MKPLIKPPRKTHDQLAAELVDLRACLEAARSECKRADDRAGKLRADLDEVKERLAGAEAENNRMRGYLDRVMEDDHVREELVPTGDPEGELQLLPKRKHRNQPGIYVEGPRDLAEMMTARQVTRSREKRRHWVTY